MIYRFCPYKLDTDRFEFWFGADLVAVEPQVFSLLLFLIENRDRVVSKDELIEHVWKGRIVSDATVSSRITAARRIVGDSGKQQAIIRTVARRGFRFVADITEPIEVELSTTVSAHSLVEPVGHEQANSAASGNLDINIFESMEPLRLPDKTAAAPSKSVDAVLNRPAVAVLPFTNMSGDAEQEYFADGLTEDIITVLAAWRSFPVIARNSTFAYKGQVPDVRQVANELGARYVLEGSVRKAGNQLRITIQLIDANTGHHLWAEKFDRNLDDVFSLQDEIAQRTGAIVGPELGRAEQNRSFAKKPKNLDAWDYYQRGMSLLYQYTKEKNGEARKMFERAIELDPNYSQPFTGLAYSYQLDVLNEYTDCREDSIAKLFEAARRAVALDETDSMAHVMMGFACRWSRQHDMAVAEAETAVELNPSNAFAHFHLGNVLDLAGRTEDGILILGKGLQLNPQDPRMNFFMSVLARAHLNARRYEEAIGWARKASHRRPDDARARAILAIGLAHLGRRAEARTELDECESIRPGFAQRWALLREYRNPADNEHILDGLRKAGLPE